jgi:hypothetical protein
MGGKRSPLDAHKEWLLALTAAEPDLLGRQHMMTVARLNSGVALRGLIVVLLLFLLTTIAVYAQEKRGLLAGQRSLGENAWQAKGYADAVPTGGGEIQRASAGQ